jgi:hypothetical protein
MSLGAQGFMLVLLLPAMDIPDGDRRAKSKRIGGGEEGWNTG